MDGLRVWFGSILSLSSADYLPLVTPNGPSTSLARVD